VKSAQPDRRPPAHVSILPDELMKAPPDKTTILQRENERLRSELDALRQSEARYRRLHEARPDGFTRVGLDGRIREANEFFCRMVGYSEGELLAMTWRDLTPGKWHAFEEEIIRGQVLAAGHSERYEKEYRRKDGTVFPAEVRPFLVPGTGDEAPGMAAVVRDITARKRGEQALRESEEKFKTAFLTSVDACYIGTLADGMILEINPAFEKLFEYSRDEALDHTSQQLGLWVNHADRLRVREQLLAQGFVKDVETAARKKGGQEFACSLSATALQLQGRHCVIGIARDISERKAAEAALQQAEQRSRDLSVRLIAAQEAERGRFARELHDDFSQRLALLAVNLHLLRQALPADATVPRESVDDLYSQVQSLARDMRRMSHDLHPARLEQLGLVSAVRGLCEELSSGHGATIRFDTRDVSRDVPEVVALCLYRVAQEALQNVIKHSGAAAATVELTAPAGELRLVVSDEGRGFDVGAVQHKHGVGLASIRERVRAIAGRFAVDSAVGRGTRIEVRAPLDLPASETGEAREPA
jgi:PAS domain S-box-containing protein